MARDDETERYRQAAEKALQQLDWCIDYLHSIRQPTFRRDWRKTGGRSSGT